MNKKNSSNQIQITTHKRNYSVIYLVAPVKREFIEMPFKLFEYYVILCLEKGIEPNWQGLKEFRNKNKAVSYTHLRAHET